LSLYVPIVVLGVLALGFAGFSVVMGSLTGPKRWNRARLEAYECGIEPTPRTKMKLKEIKTDELRIARIR